MVSGRGWFIAAIFAIAVLTLVSSSELLKPTYPDGLSAMVSPVQTSQLQLLAPAKLLIEQPQIHAGTARTKLLISVGPLFRFDNHSGPVKAVFLPRRMAPRARDNPLA
jgi:hypothetical protein